MDLKILLDTPPWEWPRGVAKTFRELLNDRQADPSERLIAADLAGDITVMDNDTADALLAVARNAAEPEELRAKAVISFGPSLELAEMGFDDPDDVPISEQKFHQVQEELRKLYSDTGNPKLFRRRILEASVRCSAPWHRDAVREAYASGDKDWTLTAVFAMQYVPGFEKETLEALKSADRDIHYHAVIAAGNKELDDAWPHILKLVEDGETAKNLRIAAIGAIASIRPHEAREILTGLAGSDDEDIADAADVALSLLQTNPYGEDEEEDEDGDDWIN